MFMTQDVFNGCALTVAQAAASGLDMIEYATTLGNDYGKIYEDDFLVEDILTAADEALVILQSQFQEPDIDVKCVSACKILLRAITNYELSGKRKSRFFRGAIFNRQRKPIFDKVQRCKSDIIAYHFALVSGKIDPRLI